MKGISQFLPFLPDFSSFFLIFPDFFPIYPDFPPIFGKFFAVGVALCPPCHPSGYATGLVLLLISSRSFKWFPDVILANKITRKKCNALLF